MRDNPRLHFTDAERGSPELKRPIRKAEKAADQADRAAANIKKKTVKTKERMVDPATGNVTTRLKFEELDKKKPPSKLAHAVRDAPGTTVLAAAHREIAKNEDDNVGVESAHKLEETAETGGRMVQSASRSRKLKPYRKAVAAQHRLEKANVNALYRRRLSEDPHFASNPLSRLQQKRAIKKQYAAARRTGQGAGSVKKTTERTAKTATEAAKKSGEAGRFLWRHKKGALIVVALFLLVCFLLNGLSSCSVLIQGGLSGLAGSTYPAKDGDMLGAEEAYGAMEAGLQYELDHYENLHPGYDEYHYQLDEIKHDPYVLISMLSALH